MKQTLIIVLVLVVGWKLAVWIVNRNEASVELQSGDTLLAKAPIPVAAEDSMPSAEQSITVQDTAIPGIYGGGDILTGKVQPGEVVSFAKTLVGVPYVYASSDPKKGFDCSGFITYVFNHFGIAVPRSSVDFTLLGKEVGVNAAKPGDLILFTGTDPADQVVGHMGLVISTNATELQFIHSSSGKAMGVTITPLTEHYRKRFRKVIRIFPEDRF